MKQDKKDKKEDKTKMAKKESKERKIERELLYIVGFAIFLIIVFVVANSIFKSFNSFEYQGLKFTKTSIGNLPVYHYSYYFTSGAGKKLFQYNLFLKIDPRENRVGVEGDKINLKRALRTIVSINESALNSCSDSIIAIADLTKFLSDNKVNVKGGSLDFWEAGYNRNEWANCDRNPDDIIIEINSGDETKINIDDRCHKIFVNNCEILAASEKYRLQSIIDAKEN